MTGRFRIRWEPNENRAIARAEKIQAFGRSKPETSWPKFPVGDMLVHLIGANEPAMGAAIAEWGADTASIEISNRWIASLDESEAASFGLPPASKAGIEFYSTGIPSSNDFRVHVRFKSHGGIEVVREVIGAFLVNDTVLERLPTPLFELYHAAAPLTRSMDDQSRRLNALEHFTQLLESAGLRVSTDPFLDRLRIYYASGLSLSLQVEGDTFDFDPILFGRRSDDADESDSVNESTHSLLSDAQQQAFLRDFRGRGAEMQASALGGGSFVYFDPLVAKALGVIAEAKKKGKEERKRFALNPRRAFKDAFAESPKDEEAIEHLFVETDQYSERVRAIEVWRPPVLPWIKRAPNSWLPEAYGIKIENEFLNLSHRQAAELESLIREAIRKGEPDVNYQGLQIPATSSSLEAISEIKKATETDDADRGGKIEKSERSDAEAAEHGGKRFLVVGENFEVVTYEPLSGSGRFGSAAKTLPSLLKTSLKKHQVVGFDWLTSAAISGNNGAVLADDMGLGKTLQALSFIVWWKELAERQGGPTKKPTLIVAPTALQENWSNEITTHFREPGLRKRQIVSGVFLRSIKKGARDVDTGVGGLDSARLREFDLLITTYETMRDYHLSFARVAFDIVVFDEAQKIKNPASQTARAAKSLNAEFILSMTGTPVENTLQDVWSIMDVTWPGLLGSSKEFAATFDDSSASDLKRLNDVLFSASPARPPAMLRRLKSNEIDGLPPKTSKRRPSTMPIEQANAYLDVLHRVKAETNNGAMLQALHDWRSISVHPNAAPSFKESEIDALIQASARFKEAFDVLADVSRAGEKALIFLENLEWQGWLSNAIRVRFGLRENPPIINGSVPGARRQSIVDRFQSQGPGFAVLILSPKAAGVGLTITAANHVIHLSRWWNPAVEDQATDRTHRIGQTKPVTVYIPQAIHPSLAKGASFDEKLDRLIEGKRLMSGTFLAPSEVRAEELAEFFRDVVSAEAVGADSGDRGSSAISSGELQKNSDESSVAGRERQESQSPASPSADPLPLGSLIEIPEVSEGQPRPIEAATRLLRFGELDEIWIEDPYFVCANELDLAADFLRAQIFEKFGQPKKIHVRAFDPDHPKIRNQTNGLGKRAVEAEVRQKIGMGVRFRFEGRTAKYFHDRCVLFVLKTHSGQRTIRWNLPGGLGHWSDQRRPQQVTTQRVESMPRWTGF